MGNTPRDDANATDTGLRVFHTGDHACAYWPERVARDLVLDPRDERLPQLYAPALAAGFRRSGDIVYRPHCRGCRACVAVRLPVADFVPDRGQRRCLARNADVDVRIVQAQRSEEQLAWARREGRSHLYLGYWIAGHAKMDYKRRFRPLEGFDGRAWKAL